MIGMHPNINMLEIVAEGLGPLLDDVVFIGGCATGLLITDSAVLQIRETKDVDVIVEIYSLPEYHDLSARLRHQGFREDASPDAPICRWSFNSVLVDVMPTDASILGFGNQWYADAIHSAEMAVLPNGFSIRLVTAPYFLATKLEAFHGRGKGDYIASHDLEDIIAVLDGRQTIVDEVAVCPSPLRAHLASKFTKLLADDAFQDALPGHLLGDAASQARLPLILNRIKQISVGQKKNLPRMKRLRLPSKHWLLTKVFR